MSHTRPQPSNRRRTVPTPASYTPLLRPRTTSPAQDTCCQNEVVIQLSTTLLVPDYNRFYTGPIANFQPSYLPLADGSLVTHPFIDDIINSNVNLLIVGILATIFARNILVTGDYIRRANFKQNTLFHVLFVSQALACVAFIPAIVSQFTRSFNCKVVNIVSFAATAISVSLLILWILGYKAYRCLDGSKIVMGFLLLFSCANVAVVVLELNSLQADRRLSGSCIRTSDLFFTKIYIVLQFVESLFICCCFCFTLWRSRGSPAARGRISLQLSLEKAKPRQRNRNLSTQPPASDTWHDLPQNNKTPSVVISEGKHGIEHRLVQDTQLSMPPRPFFPGGQYPASGISGSNLSHGAANDGRHSPVPSTFSRLNRYFPRMELFRKVMKDELCYTTFITGSCVAVAILAFIGLNFKNGLTVDGWISINWAVISLLAIHSFGRVIRRHERDAILREPETWNTINRTQISPNLTNKSKSFISTSIPSNRRIWRKSPNRSSEETRGLTDPRRSWDSGHSHSSFGSGLSHVLTHSPFTVGEERSTHEEEEIKPGHIVVSTDDWQPDIALLAETSNIIART